MKPIIAAAMALVFTLFTGVPNAYAVNATQPTTVKGATRLYLQDVAAIVTVDGPATITLTNVAYRHPERVQATLVATTAGTYTIVDRCQVTRLPHDWVVYVNGVVMARSKPLKCA